MYHRFVHLLHILNYCFISLGHKFLLWHLRPILPLLIFHHRFDFLLHNPLLWLPRPINLSDAACCIEAQRILLVVMEYLWLCGCCCERHGVYANNSQCLCWCWVHRAPAVQNISSSSTGFSLVWSQENMGNRKCWKIEFCLVKGQFRRMQKKTSGQRSSNQENT